MKNINKKHFAYLILSLFGLAAILFAFFDAPITKAIGNENSSWAKICEIIGEPPAIFLAIFALAVIFFVRTSTAERILYSAIMFGGGFYIVNQTYIYVYGTSPSLWLPILGGISLCAIGLLCVSLISAETRRRIFVKCVIIALSAVATLVIISMIKLIWGRVRPRELDNAWSEFSCYLVPHFFSGHHSFPSGHTANATLIYSLTLFSNQMKNKVARYFAKTILVVYILLLALSRVVIKAHFASDVLFGFGITMAIFLFVKSFVYFKVGERDVTKIETPL